MWYKLLADLDWKMICLTLAFVLMAYLNDKEYYEKHQQTPIHNAPTVFEDASTSFKFPH